VRAGDAILAEIGGLQAAIGQEAATAELLVDRPAAAEARLRRAYAHLDEMGEKALLAGTASMLAHVLIVQGIEDEVDELCAVAERSAADDDLAAQIGWRAARARLLARLGRAGEAAALAEEAVRIAARTDFLTVHAEALTDLGAVLRMQGRSEDSRRAMREATELYRRKGDVVSLARWEDDLRTEGPHAEVLVDQDRGQEGGRHGTVSP
jgi:hypothetical protein